MIWCCVLKLRHTSFVAHLGQVITRAIPHRSINFRISQLFTQFPLIWFSNFEFLEPRKLIFYSNYILFHSLCCLLKSATQSSHTTPHHTSSAMPLVQHTQSERVFWRIVLESQVYRSIIKDTQHPTYFFIKNFITQMYYCKAISRTNIMHYQIQSQHIFATMMVLFTNWI